MTANKHTPAPWVMHESATHVRIVGADGENIWHEDKRCHRVMNDARLIASAPELLEILRNILPFVATQAIGCHGDKCREEWCFSCNGEEDAEAAAKRGSEFFAEAHSLIAKVTGGAA